METPENTQVFRIIPKIGRCYKYADWTTAEKDGKYERLFYTDKEPTYVGECVNFTRMGSDASRQITADFNNNGVINTVVWGERTSFIEVDCESEGGRKRRRKKRRKKSRKKTKKRRKSKRSKRRKRRTKRR